MEYTAHYTLPDLSLPLGHNQAVQMHMAGPILLDISFVYEDATPARPPLAFGEHGEEAQPEYFDFKSIVTPHPLVLASDDGNIRTVMSAGVDLVEQFSDAQRSAIEADLILRRREGRLQALLDQAVIGRFLNLEALQ